MPYNAKDKAGSWKHLLRHAENSSDHWVRLESNAPCPHVIRAILCIATSGRDTTPFDSSFKCELREKQVLLFLRNEVLGEPMHVAVEVVAYSPNSTWLIKDIAGELYRGGVYKLDPKIGAFIRFATEYRPIVLFAEPVAEPKGSIDSDTVTVTARIAYTHPWDSKGPTEIWERRKRPRERFRIRAGDTHIELSVAADLRL